VLRSGDDLLGGHERVPGDTIEQGQKESCKRFLEKNIGELSITDFSLHSIGVILFNRYLPNFAANFLNPNLDSIS
jgi:uncharacterized protein